jgi:hypothetical protein
MNVSEMVDLCWTAGWCPPNEFTTDLDELRSWIEANKNEIEARLAARYAELEAEVAHIRLTLLALRLAMPVQLPQ